MALRSPTTSARPERQDDSVPEATHSASLTGPRDADHGRTVLGRGVFNRRRVVWCGVLLGLVVLVSGLDRDAAAPVGGAGLAGTAAPPHSLQTLRLASFNIHAGRDASGHFDLSRTAATLAGADVVGLNEVRGYWRTASGDQAQHLGALLEMQWAFAPSERRWWNDCWGNGLLSRHPVRGWQSHPLINTRGKAFRNYILAELTLQGRPVQLAVTHVDNFQDHAAQMATIAELFLSLSEPAVLMGDLNATSDDPVLARLLATPGVIDAVAEVEGVDHAGRIDWILVRGLRVVAAEVRDDGASDHPCLFVELALEEQQSERRSFTPGSTLAFGPGPEIHREMRRPR